MGCLSVLQQVFSFLLALIFLLYMFNRYRLGEKKHPGILLNVSSGHQLHVLCMGSPINPPVFMIPGNGYSAYSLAELALGIWQDAFVCTYDRPNLGHSSKDPLDKPSLVNMTRDILEIFDLHFAFNGKPAPKNIESALPVGQKITLVGHSMGGVLAQLVALQIPERIQAAFLLDPPLPGFYDELKAGADANGDTLFQHATSWYKFGAGIAEIGILRLFELLPVGLRMPHPVPDRFKASALNSISETPSHFRGSLIESRTQLDSHDSTTYDKFKATGIPHHVYAAAKFLPDNQDMYGLNNIWLNDRRWAKVSDANHVTAVEHHHWFFEPPHFGEVVGRIKGALPKTEKAAETQKEKSAGQIHREKH